VKITLIDYGAGNLPSVERALQKFGAETERVNTPDFLERAEAIVLPGVGHFAALVHSIDERGLREPLLAAIKRGVPFLGICLGLQALFESSEEAPELPGLGLLKGAVRALPPRVKLPHMGWNQVRSAPASRIFRGLSPDLWFYFAHSYAAMHEGSSIAAVCSHGTDFIAAIESENIWAVQFHPEKSAAPGANVLANFLEFAQ